MILFISVSIGVGDGGEGTAIALPPHTLEINSSKFKIIRANVKLFGY